MRYGSVCSGIEAATVAWDALGWTPAFFSEIEPFPCSVLRYHYPHVPNHGDMTKFQEWPLADIDVLVGGTPCQSFSVAGLRQGLADPRGNLMLTYLAIAQRYRPEWVVWENVPGVLSSNGGRDFGTFLAGLAECGYGWAYRVLDAQYFGLAQRRKRVFVVGSTRGWAAAAAVLFERESLLGNPAPSREPGQRITGPIAGCSNGGGANGPGRTADDADSLITHALRADGFDGSEDGTGRGTPLVMSSGQANAEIAHDQSPTLTCLHEVPIAFNWQAGESDDPSPQNGFAPPLRRKQVPAVAFSCKDYGADAGEIAPTLRSMTHDGSHANGGGQVAVAFSENQRGELCTNETTQALNKGGGKPGQGYPAAMVGMQVRRLTPKECARLQGFPDDYLDIPYRGKPAADGPKYKALGNSMAVPVMRWIGSRIAMVDELCMRRTDRENAPCPE